MRGDAFARGAVRALLLVALVGAVAAPAHAPARQDAVDDAGRELPVPGGNAFVRGVAGMAPPTASPLTPRSLPLQLAEHLDPPRMQPVAERLGEALDDLRDLRAELDALRGEAPPRLGGPGDDRARAILALLGLRPVPEDDPARLEPVADGARSRELLGHAGIDVEAAAAGWVQGEPLDIEIVDSRARLPEPFPRWDALFGEPVPETGRLRRLLEDGTARSLVLGLGRLDRPTRAAVLRNLELGALRDRRRARRLAALAPYLRVDREVGFVPPGADPGSWGAILGADGGDLARMVPALLDAPGPIRHLWRALALVPPARARYLLTLGRPDPAARADWARRLAAAVQGSEIVDELRWPDDVAELFAALELLGDGSPDGDGVAGIDWPGGARAWLAALGLRRPPGDGTAVEAARDAVAGRPDAGPEVDAEILEALVRGADPDRPGDSTISAWLAVTDALRYQPRSTVARAVPVLFPAWSRIGHAYGFLAVPTQLRPETVTAFGLHALRVETLDGPARAEAARQLQATLLLVRRLLRNGMLGDRDRPAVLGSLFRLPVEPRAAGREPAGGDDSVAGYGPGLAEWYRRELLPAAARGLQARGWTGDATDLREVLFAAVVGNVEATPLQVDGIDYRYNAVVDLGDRMSRHLVEQHVPVLDRLLALDELAARAGGGDETDDPVTLADEIEELLTAVRRAVPDVAARGDLDDRHPVPVPRPVLFDAGPELAAALRAGTPGPELAARVRRAVASWMGDALTGLAYALHLGSGEVADHRHLVWSHRVDPADGDDSDLSGPWRPTDVAWDPDEGEVLRNGLMGIPDHAGRWRLQDAAVAAGGAQLDPAVERAWGATLGRIHLPTLDDDTQAEVRRIHRSGQEWVRAAAAARDTGLPAGPGRAGSPELRQTLRLLLPPTAAEEVLDAVAAGSERGALRRLTPGIAFTLGTTVEGEPTTPGARWRLDQLVGMAVGRPGRGLGLAVPEPIRYGEAADGEPALYARLLDVRVALALAMGERALPATLHGRLLAEAMAAALGDVRSPGPAPWRDLLAAIPGAVDAGDVGDWTVGLAFSDELEPADPAEAAEVRQRRRDAALGGAWRPAGLRLPGEADEAPQQAPVFRTTVELATVDVSVWGDDGRFVTGLEAGDFTVHVEGREVTPSFVRLEGSAEATAVQAALPAAVAERLEPAGRNLVLIADLQATPGPRWRQVLDDALELLRSGLAPRDRVAVIEIDTGGTPRLRVGFTREHRAAATALEAMQPGGSAVSAGGMQRALRELPRTLCDNSVCDCRNQALCSPAMTPSFGGCVTRCPSWESRKISAARSLSRSFAFEELSRARNQIDVLRGIAETLESGDPASRPKTLLFLSPGFEVQVGRGIQEMLADYSSAATDVNPGLRLDLATATGVDDLRPELSELVESLRRCRCTLYTVDTLGLNRRLVDAGTRVDVGDAAMAVRRSLQDSLNALARDTGGRPFLNSSDYERAFATVLDESRLRYVLGIPVGELDLEAGDESRWRQVRVEVAREGVTVRSREGFFWPAAE